MAILAGNARCSSARPPRRRSPPRARRDAAGRDLFGLAVALTHRGLPEFVARAGIATTKTITGADGKTFRLVGRLVQQERQRHPGRDPRQTLSSNVAALAGRRRLCLVCRHGGRRDVAGNHHDQQRHLRGALAGGSRRSRPSPPTIPPTRTTPMTGCCGGAEIRLQRLCKTMAAAPPGPARRSRLGRGSVNEIDDMFQQMWNLYQVSPTRAVRQRAGAERNHAKVLSNASGPLLRYEVSGGDGIPYDLAAAGAVSFYFNPFALNGGLKIPVRIHPRVPPGTIIGFAGICRSSTSRTSAERRRDQDPTRITIRSTASGDPPGQSASTPKRCWRSTPRSQWHHHEHRNG